MEGISEPGLMSVLSDPRNLISFGGLFLLLLIIYLETGFFVGLVLPGGDYLIFTAGLLAGTHYLEVPIYILLPAMIGAAILGDFTGYAKGKWLGPRLFNKEDNMIFKKSYLTRSRWFYRRYGLGAFIIGRFLPVVRTMGPMVAGASRVSLGRFTVYNILGAVIWIATLAPLGYFLGSRYPQMMNYSVYFLLGFVLIASAPLITSLFRLKAGKIPS